MPIGQLLASITGEKPAAPTPPSRPQNAIPVKRKADDEVGKSSPVPKAPKTTATLTRPSGVDAAKISRPADRPSSGYAGSARPTTTSTTTTPRPLAERSASSASKKLMPTSNGKPSLSSTSLSSSARNPSSSSSSSLAKRPIPTATASADSSSKAPKKGSIAEIKARAAAQQAKLLAIGKIQHKATEKPLTKKEREEAAAEEARAAKKGLKPGMKLSLGGGPGGGSGTSRSGTPSHVDRARGAIQKPSGGKSPTKASAGLAVAEERKVKKAALATTGYAGSARPKPKAASSRPGASGADARQREGRPNPMGMFSKPRSRRDEEYDEELDDFIDDDEEEEDDGYGYGSRYRYADEDDESDMEAGYSDVEDEEEAAMRYARKEDAREQAILEQRKREKEARKKGLVSGRR